METPIENYFERLENWLESNAEYGASIRLGKSGSKAISSVKC